MFIVSLRLQHIALVLASLEIRQQLATGVVCQRVNNFDQLCVYLASSKHKMDKTFEFRIKPNQLTIANRRQLS